ncbi:hypothetical protein CVIRNUC_005417 [Coccomyxa viridis]|uniref:Uncharacterized protein n=1 Tax=Coccomyxa viridis TaxID=1274662 RepID=A0AAV1I8G1_9CHLO|nr:hypothetical protein CVIRNUC_005417 [Coccomyxa viridis]
MLKVCVSQGSSPVSPADRSNRANVPHPQTAQVPLLNGIKLQLWRLGRFPSNAVAVVKQSCAIGGSLAILLSCIPRADAGALQISVPLQVNTANGRLQQSQKVTGSIHEAIDSVSRLTSEAEAAIRDGDMHTALQRYTTITREYSDLALAERARVKRALMLYETGSVGQALLELEDEEVALRGNAEVHAAMAALLYAEKPMERQRAELQWDIATEFDSRYGSIEWVAKSKVWGPRLLQALQKFLSLQ